MKGENQPAKLTGATDFSCPVTAATVANFGLDGESSREGLGDGSIMLLLFCSFNETTSKAVLKSQQPLDFAFTCYDFQ